MGAALLIARSRLRANLTATVLLVLLAGFGGGIVMASVAGIRRAEGSWEQLQRENPDGDAAVAFLGPDGAPIEGEQTEEIEQLAALPEVLVASRASAVVGVLRDDAGDRWPVAANTYLDVPHPALVGRPVIVDGAMPRSRRRGRDGDRRADGRPGRSEGRRSRAVHAVPTTGAGSRQ